MLKATVFSFFSPLTSCVCVLSTKWHVLSRVSRIKVCHTHTHITQHTRRWFDHTTEGYIGTTTEDDGRFGENKSRINVSCSFFRSFFNHLFRRTWTRCFRRDLWQSFRCVALVRLPERSIAFNKLCLFVDPLCFCVEILYPIICGINTYWTILPFLLFSWNCKPMRIRTYFRQKEGFAILGWKRRKTCICHLSFVINFCFEMMKKSCSPDSPVSARTDDELLALNRSFDLSVNALGGDRDRVGDAIYGALTGSLLTMKAGTTGTGLEPEPWMCQWFQWS